MKITAAAHVDWKDYNDVPEVGLKGKPRASRDELPDVWPQCHLARIADMDKVQRVAW